jgi:hypothetical protein
MDGVESSLDILFNGFAFTAPEYSFGPPRKILFSGDGSLL